MAGVEIGCLNEFPVETIKVAGQQELHVRLGDLVSAQELTVGIAVRCHAGAAGDSACITVRLADRDHVALSAADADRVARGGRLRRCCAACERRRARSSGDAPRRTRAQALEANRRGDFEQASAILNAAAAELRTLGRDIPRIEALAAELEAEQGNSAPRWRR